MIDQTSPDPLPIARGLLGRCPRCGEGKLFQGFLGLRERCDRCGLDNKFAEEMRFSRAAATEGRLVAGGRKQRLKDLCGRDFEGRQ